MLMRIMESSYKAMIIFNAMDNLDTKIYDAQSLPKPLISQKPSYFDIKFKDVSFTYEGMKEKALHQLSFECQTDSVTAIVGPSGSGKSTIFNLITRFYDVGSGTVMIGDVDVRDMAYEDLMSNISYVFQETKLFKTSLLENIRFTDQRLRDEVEQVIDQAQCREIINKMPNGLDTVFGTSGSYLSGGKYRELRLHEQC